MNAEDFASFAVAVHATVATCVAIALAIRCVCLSHDLAGARNSCEAWQSMCHAAEAKATTLKADNEKLKQQNTELSASLYYLRDIAQESIEPTPQPEDLAIIDDETA